MQTIHDERVDLLTWVGVLGTMLGAFRFLGFHQLSHR